MPENQNRFSRFWSKVKSRKIIQVIIIYASTSFVLLQLPVILDSYLVDFPAWINSLLLILLIVGFPLVILFTWIFNHPQIPNDADDSISEKNASSKKTKKKIPTEIPDKSIIVLPFDNLSPDPEQEYFSDGLTEEITADLAHIPGLLVISRSSAMTFKGSNKTITEIAEKVKVRYVLEGSVRKAQENIRITAQLIDAKTDTHLWAKKYNGTIQDIFDIQEKVSAAIAQDLEIKITNARKAESSGSISDIKVFEHFYKANSNIFKFDEDAIRNTILYLDDVLNESGIHPLLYTCKAWAYWSLVNLGLEQDDYLELAKENLLAALAIDPHLPRAHSILGWVVIVNDIKQANDHFKKALRYDSSEIFGLQGLTVLLACIGKTQKANQFQKEIEKVDPLNHLTFWLKGGIPFYNGEFEKAHYEWKNMFNAGFKDSSAVYYIALSMLYIKEVESVLEYIEPFINFNSKKSFDKLIRILKYALIKDTEKLLSEIDKDFTKTCSRDFTYSHHLAVSLAVCNLKKEGLKWLQIAVEKGFINYPMLAEKDVLLDNLRDEPEFLEIVKQVKILWEPFE